MYIRDSAVVRAIHADRVRDHVGGPRPLPALRPARRQRNPVRRTVGRVIVRFGAWLAAERAESLLKPAS